MRLAVPRLLKDKVEHFIYLDADTLCFDKLNDINSIDISNVICAVSHDSLDIHDTKNAKRLGLSTGNYFNAGFLYINIENWVKHDIENKANTSSKFLLPIAPCVHAVKILGLGLSGQYFSKYSVTIRICRNVFLWILFSCNR